MNHTDLTYYLNRIDAQREKADNHAANGRLREAIYALTTALQVLAELTSALAGEQHTHAP